MTTSAILFGTGLALVVAYFVMRPFFDGSVFPDSTGYSSERLHLLEHKAAILTAIREIDADAETGKLEPADHRFLRQRYLAEGAAVMKALDVLPAGDSIDGAIEEEIARLRKRPLEIPGQLCPSCGSLIGHEDRFCARCGASLEG